jgi:metal-responsive CopG/Arc/MetJ family transcriptional regulator
MVVETKKNTSTKHIKGICVMPLETKKSYQVSVRLPKDSVRDIDALATNRGTNRSKMVIRLIADALEIAMAEEEFTNEQFNLFEETTDQGEEA